MITITASGFKAARLSRRISADGCSSRSSDFHLERRRPAAIDPNNQNVIGTIDSAGTTVLLDPVLGITFAVTAGAANTTFTVTSALVSFPGITNAEVRATSNFGVNDVSGTPAGAALAGQLGGFAYRTAYNGYVPGGTTFDTQIPGVIAVPPNNSANTGDDSGLAIVPGTISNMSSQVSFELTERDRANGTVNFSVKPEPTTLALLALGALVSARRRQSAASPMR